MERNMGRKITLKPKTQWAEPKRERKIFLFLRDFKRMVQEFPWRKKRVDGSILSLFGPYCHDRHLATSFLSSKAQIWEHNSYEMRRLKQTAGSDARTRWLSQGNESIGDYLPRTRQSYQPHPETRKNKAENTCTVQHWTTFGVAQRALGKNISRIHLWFPLHHQVLQHRWAQIGGTTFDGKTLNGMITIGMNRNGKNRNGD